MMLMFVVLQSLISLFSPYQHFFIAFTLCIIINILLLYALRWRRKSQPFTLTQSANGAPQLTVIIVLGSGGHTTEMLRLVKGLGPHYYKRVYFIADTDKTSENRLLNMESIKNSGVFEIIKISRSREVGQSYMSSVYTTLQSLFGSAPAVLKIKADLVLANGPGTCFPICVVAYLMDLLLIKSSRIVFVESFCRVETLSTTGEILYYTRIADRILVQWPHIKRKYKRVQFVGRF